MKKEFRPQTKNLVGNYAILYLFIFIFLIIFYINSSSLYVSLIFTSGFIFLIGLDAIIQLRNLKRVIFDDKRLIITKGFNKKIKEIIQYEQINIVSSTTYGNRLLTQEHLVINHYNKKNVVNLRIYQSFFSNEEFRQIHLEFMERLPSYKIKFDRDYYNL